MTSAHLTRIDVAAVSEDAFVFAYPLVLMELARIAMTSVPAPDDDTMRAPVNQLVHARRRPGAGALAHLGADTLSSSAWLDLADEPMVLSVPDTHGRYYVISLIDGRPTFRIDRSAYHGHGRGKYAIGLGSALAAASPAGVMPIAAPTRYVRIAGETSSAAASPTPTRSGTATGSRRSAARRCPRSTRLHGRCGPSSSPAELVDRLDAEAFFRTGVPVARGQPATHRGPPSSSNAFSSSVSSRAATTHGWGATQRWQLKVEQGARRGRDSVRHRAAAVMGGGRRA